MRPQSSYIRCSKSKWKPTPARRHGISELVLKAYLKHIEKAKRAVKIPIIASLNCTTLGGWIRYARQITEAGADALELNIYKIPTKLKVTGSTIEKGYIDVVRTVRLKATIPLAVKLSPYFSNFANMAASL